MCMCKWKLECANVLRTVPFGCAETCVYVLVCEDVCEGVGGYLCDGWHDFLSYPFQPTALAELKPADVDKMLKPMAPFEGFRLEGDNIHRGKGNYMVSRSSFACNRVRTLSITKWVVREYENVLVPDERHGLFFSAEGYVIRWAYRITVVKELEGLTPGAGQFAQDKKYQKSLQPQPSKPGDGAKDKPGDGSDSEPEGNNNEECKKLLESGGRDRCAYFFWQGEGMQSYGYVDWEWNSYM